jgi:hypothetical protein
MKTCMGSDAIKEFKTQDQRVAVCLSIYRKHHKKGKAKLGAPPDMNEMVAEIAQTNTIVDGDKIRVLKLPTFP